MRGNTKGKIGRIKENDSQLISTGQLPSLGKKYLIKCDACGEFFDSRSLGQVFAHLHHSLATPGRCLPRAKRQNK